MPGPVAHCGERSDKGQVDGDESDEDVVNRIKSIFEDLEKFRSHYCRFLLNLLKRRKRARVRIWPFTRILNQIEVIHSIL